MDRAKVEQAWNLLRYTFGVGIIVAGIDKFESFHFIIHWEQYVSGPVLQMLMMDASKIVFIAGIAEVVVGGLIIFKTRLGAMIAIGWMIAIIINLLFMGMYYDIIFRDALLAVSLTALWLLTDALGK